MAKEDEIGEPAHANKRKCERCGHLEAVHSKRDGRCLGGTYTNPMSCDCRCE